MLLLTLPLFPLGCFWISQEACLCVKELDNPECEVLFRHALPIEWTRDPFDRLLMAHATLRRWRFATGDRAILERLPADRAMAL